jgi:hypothetical protein
MITYFFNLTLNPCSNIANFWPRFKNIRRSSLSYMPTRPKNSRNSQSSALASRTNKVDSNCRAILKFNVFVFNTLSMFIEKYFLYQQTLKPLSRVKNTELRFWESRNCRRLLPAFLTYIWTLLWSTFFLQRTTGFWLGYPWCRACSSYIGVILLGISKVRAQIPAAGCEFGFDFSDRSNLKSPEISAEIRTERNTGVSCFAFFVKNPRNEALRGGSRP